jgi:predicted nucleotidyltransferase
MESGYTELDKPRCRYCDKETVLTVVSKEKISIEAITKRLKASADNMMNALKGAYETMPDDLKNIASEEFDPEKELLKTMAKAKSFNENLHKLKLKKKTRGKKS